MRELADPQLVHDLARLGVAPIVALARLVAGEDVERAAGEIRIEDAVLQRHDQAVAAEQTDEPGHPRGGDELHVAGALEWQSQRGHVLGGLVEVAQIFVVAGGDLQRLVTPLPALLRGRRVQERIDAGARPIHPLLVEAELVDQAGVPPLAGLKGDVEAYAAVGINRLGLALANAHSQFAFEVAIDIGRSQPRLARRPVGCHAGRDG